MKSIIALLFMCSIAHADATLTLALTGATSANSTKTLVISDADGIRFLNWAKSRSAIGATNAEATGAVLQALIDSIRTGVQDWERANAASTVQPITPK